MDLPDFLLARIAEDEETACDATTRDAEWFVSAPVLEWGRDEDPVVLTGGKPLARCEGAGAALIADHIARHDPARVLAECEAKRRIVNAESRWRRTKDNVLAETFKLPHDGIAVTWWDETGRPHEETVTQPEFRERFTEPSPPSDTLKFLALPYADHPDFDEAWKP